jgi:hypothetical protein
VMGAVVSILVHNLFDKPTMSREWEKKMEMQLEWWQYEMNPHADCMRATNPHSHCD